MNKLISRNPVLRFKNGRLILIFLSGGTAYNKLARKWGTRKNDKGEEFIRDPKTGNVFFKDGRIIENNGSGEVRKVNTFGGTTKLTNNSPSRFETNARYLGLDINTNSNGNRFYTQNGLNFFENGDVYNVNDGKNKVRVVKDFAELYHPANNKKDTKSNSVTSSESSTTSNAKSSTTSNAKSNSITSSRTSMGARTKVLPNRAVNGYMLPEGVTNVSEILNLLVKEGYLLPKYKVDGLWGAETQAAWEAKKSFDELQNMKENFGNNHPTPTTISPELQQAFTRTTPDYIGESTNEPLTFLLPQNVNRKYVRSMIRTFGRNPYEDYTPQERILMRNEINNGTFDANKWFGELGLNNILPIQSDLQTVATSSTNTPPSSLYNMGGFNRFLTNWLNQNPRIYNNLANIFTTHQPSVATPTYIPNYNYNENNPLTYRYATSIYKQGGLISKNPVKLFKQNFRKGAL